MCHARHHHRHRVSSVPAPHTPDQPHLRVSDAERERTAETLRAHAGEGRLDADELEERLGRVFAAKTRADLDALTRDLPEARRAGAPRHEDERMPPFIPLAVLLVAIWAVTGAGYFWPMWPLMFFAFAGFAHMAKRSAGNTHVIR